jgi:RNA polymerase sigma-70 factor (ECF subfamily)
MAEESDSLEGLSKTLGERLRQGDEHALTVILERFENYIRRHLRSRFGCLLPEEDLDDVLSRALYRLWLYRQRYDPEKASLASWFYLIARSSALEVLREKRVSAAGKGLLTDQPLPPRLETPESPELRELEEKLQQLPEQDQIILLTFARYGGADNWAANLAAEWGMPAATIRSRKRRALAHLRRHMTHEGPPTSRRTIMPDAPIHAEKDWDEIADRLRDFFSRIPPGQTGDGLAGLEERWNDTLNEPAPDEERQQQRLKILQNAWRWAKGRAEGKDEALKQVNAFVERSLNSLAREPDSEERLRAAIAKHPREDLLQRIQRSLSGIGAAIERNMTTETRRSRKGEALLSWTSEDADISWKDKPQPVVRLRPAAQRAFAVHGEIPGEESLWLADQLVAEIASRHHLCIPCFFYPDNLQAGQKPPTLHWVRGETRVVEESGLPLRMQTRERLDLHVPAPIELELARRDAALAELLDRALCAAATADQRSQETFAPAKDPEEGDASSRLADLVQLVSARTGRELAEVVALFRQALLLGQRDVKSAEDCNARTQALAFLWAYLNEPG